LRPARGGQGGQLPWPSRGRGHWRHVSPGSGVGRAVSAVLGSWAHFLTGRHGGLQGTRPDRVVGRCGLAVWRGWPGGALAVRWQGSNALVPCWRCVFPRHVFQGRRSTASRSPMGWPGLGRRRRQKEGVSIVHGLVSGQCAPFPVRRDYVEREESNALMPAYSCSLGVLTRMVG
jgi:hypothetical protein